MWAPGIMDVKERTVQQREQSVQGGPCPAQIPHSCCNSGWQLLQPGAPETSEPLGGSKGERNQDSHEAMDMATEEMWWLLDGQQPIPRRMLAPTIFPDSEKGM